MDLETLSSSPRPQTQRPPLLCATWQTALWEGMCAKDIDMVRQAIELHGGPIPLVFQDQNLIQWCLSCFDEEIVQLLLPKEREVKLFEKNILDILQSEHADFFHNILLQNFNQWCENSFSYHSLTKALGENPNTVQKILLDPQSAFLKSMVTDPQIVHYVLKHSKLLSSDFLKTITQKLKDAPVLTQNSGTVFFNLNSIEELKVWKDFVTSFPEGEFKKSLNLQLLKMDKMFPSLKGGDAWITGALLNNSDFLNEMLKRSDGCEYIASFVQNSSSQKRYEVLRCFADHMAPMYWDADADWKFEQVAQLFELCAAYTINEDGVTFAETVLLNTSYMFGCVLSEEDDEYEEPEDDDPEPAYTYENFKTLLTAGVYLCEEPVMELSKRLESDWVDHAKKVLYEKHLSGLGASAPKKKM